MSSSHRKSTEDNYYNPRYRKDSYIESQENPISDKIIPDSVKQGERQIKELNDLFETALSKGNSIELKKLSDSIIHYYKYKNNKILTEKLTQIDILNEQKTFYAKLQRLLQNLVIEACCMSDIEARNGRLKRIYFWYTNHLEAFKSIAHMKERTDGSLEPDPPEPLPMTEEEGRSHRTDIYGFEDAKDKIKEYQRKVVLTDPELDKDTSNDHYYYNKNRLKNNITSYNFNLAGGSTFYTTKTGNSTCYSTKGAFNFYKPSANNWINNTGTNWYNQTEQMPYFNFDKEIKGSFSHIRPGYNYSNLKYQRDIIIAKNRLMKEKRMEENIKQAVNDFGIIRARYKGELNKKFEMKDMIEEYTKKLNERKGKDKQKEQLIQIEHNEEKNANNNSNNNIKESENLKKGKTKVDLSKVKYITQLAIGDYDINYDSPFFNETESEGEKIITINCKLNKEGCIEKLMNSQINEKLNKDKELKLEMLNTKDQNEKKAYQKKMELNSISGESLAYLTFCNPVIAVRQMNSTLNSFKNFDKPKTDYKQYLKPLSLFDSVNYQGRQHERHKTEGGIAMQVFHTSPNDFLSLRQSISQFREQSIKESKIYKKGSRKLRYHLKLMSQNPIK